MSQRVSQRVSQLVSTIYYNDLIIEVYWDSNVLVHNSGLWVILRNMTIRNVLYSLGFKNNTIRISEDVIDMNVSSAPVNVIHILNTPSNIIEYDDLYVSKPGCIQSIMKKLKF